MLFRSDHRIRFVDIDAVVGTVISEHDTKAVESFEQLEEVDARSRARAIELVAAL